MLKKMEAGSLYRGIVINYSSNILSHAVNHENPPVMPWTTDDSTARYHEAEQAMEATTRPLLIAGRYLVPRMSA
jgi:hypothetical protein